MAIGSDSKELPEGLEEELAELDELIPADEPEATNPATEVLEGRPATDASEGAEFADPEEALDDGQSVLEADFPGLSPKLISWRSAIATVEEGLLYAALNHHDSEKNQWLFSVADADQALEAFAISLRLNELGVPAPAFRQIRRQPPEAFKEAHIQRYWLMLQVVDLDWLVRRWPEQVRAGEWPDLITEGGALNGEKAYKFASMNPTGGMATKVNWLGITRRQQRELYVIRDDDERERRSRWFQTKGKGSQGSALNRLQQAASKVPGPNPDPAVMADRLTAIAMTTTWTNGKPSPKEVSEWYPLICGKFVQQKRAPQKIITPVARYMGEKYDWVPEG